MKTNNYNILKNNQDWQKENNYDLDSMLEEISIQTADEVDGKHIEGWFAVVDCNGINAYFSTEKEALAYRLFLINRVLNG